MAKVTSKGFDELERLFTGLGKKTTPLMKRTVYAGAGDVADNVRSNMTGAIKESTGQLESGLSINRISAVNGRVSTSVGFDGYGTYHGTVRPLPLIAAVLDSGRSDQSGRDKTHFFTNAVRTSRKTALNKMEQEFAKAIEDAVEQTR